MIPTPAPSRFPWRRGLATFFLMFYAAAGGMAVEIEEAPLTAAPFLIDVWTAEQGLSNASVSAVAQSPDGYLWIGTQYGGLIRFDGLHFTRAMDAAGAPLAVREVTVLDVDEDGTMWVLMNGPYRLMSYRDGRFRLHTDATTSTGDQLLRRIGNRGDDAIFISVTGRLASVPLHGEGGLKWLPVPPVRMLGGCGDGRKRVWIRPREGPQLQILEDRSREPVTPLQPEGAVGVVAYSPAGVLWTGGVQGLASWDGNVFHHLDLPAPLFRENIRQISFSGDGGMWVMTPTRVIKHLGGRWVAAAKPWKPGPVAGVSAIFRADRDGGVWLTENGAGLVHIDPAGGVMRVGVAEGLPDTAVTAWQQDNEGGIWVGTAGGLARLRPRLLQVVGAGEGLANPVVRSVAQDAAGRIWLAGTNGLSMCTDGRFRFLPAPSAGAVNPVMDVVALGGPQDPMWIGTVSAGAYAWSSEQKPIYPFPPTEVGLAVRTLCRDRDGGVWFGGEFGLYRWKDASLTRFGVEQGLLPGQIFDIRQAANGDLWLTKAGTELVRYRAGRFEQWMPQDSHENLALAVLPDAVGDVWVGTLGGGLLRWHEGRFFRFTSSHGLPCDSISQLLTDDQGALWAGTQQGIFRVPLDELKRVAEGEARKATFRSFGSSDGMASVECSAGPQPSALRAADGTLWFPTLRGAVVLDPKADFASKPTPPVRIREVRVDGVLSPAAAAPGGPALRLPPGRHTVEISFAGLSLTAPEKVRYQHRVIGVDPAWVECGNQREVSYGKLPYGEYLFEVMACNDDNRWGPAPARFRFIIEPHVWETRAFQAGAIAVLVVGASFSASGIQHLRHRKEMAHAEARRVIEGERARIARDLHDDLGAGLAQINISSGLVASTGMAADGMAPLLYDIGSRSRELIAALDEIVWAINPKNDSVASLATYLCQFSQNFLQVAGIRCRLEVPLDLPELPLNAEQRHSLFLAFAEAIHNAVQHSQATEVRVAIELESKLLRLTVADNGCGLPEGPCPEGADGLSNMHQRLTQLRGSCQIVSRPGEGTTVVFILPVNPRWR